VDLLLLRIEIDNSRIVDQNEKIKRINLENSIENTTRMYQNAANAALNSPLNHSSNVNYSPTNYSPTSYSPTNHSPYPGQSLGSPYSPSRFTDNYDNSRENLIHSPVTPTTRYGIPASPVSKTQMIMTNNSNDRPGRRFNNSADRHKRQPSGIASMYSNSSISDYPSPNIRFNNNINGEITEHGSEAQKFAIYEEAKRLYK